MRLTLVLCLLFVAAPVSAQTRHDGWLHLALGAYMTAQGADLATSCYAFGRGGFRETNPLLRPLQDKPVAFAIAKMGIASVTSYGLVRLHRTRPKTALVLAVAGTSLFSVIAVHNSRLVTR